MTVTAGVAAQHVGQTIGDKGYGSRDKHSLSSYHFMSTDQEIDELPLPYGWVKQLDPKTTLSFWVSPFRPPIPLIITDHCPTR
jgi:hypothetical protein